MTYYIDPMNGSESSDGSSAANARREYLDLDLLPGDTVLFKRGSFIRGCLYRRGGTPELPITYGAYGQGENPVFCGSIDVSAPEKWKEIGDNIWQYTEDLPSEACNFIFDGGRIGGTLRWEAHLLSESGDWYDNRMGGREVTERKLLLYSRGNPGEVYSHIECAVFGERTLSPNVSCTVCEDLCFFGSGVHAMSGGGRHITVRRCSFCFIGGAVWNRQLKIRFGNAIEFWDYGEDILIEDCYFNNIYDSCITHQGGDACRPAKNLVMRHNLFVNYGMGAYEGRDKMSINSAFCDNLCLLAGGGFSAFGDTSPRNSEIYPQPMGHHLFMWRIPKAESENGSLEICGNHFYDATGAAIYSIISPEADSQMKLHDNRYYTSNKRLLNRIGGVSYADFPQYESGFGESGAEYAASDIAAEAAAWFAETGCGGYGAKLFTDKLPTRKYFVGSTEKDALSYELGEDICFRLSLFGDGKTVSCPKIKYLCRGDDGKQSLGEVSGDDGTIEIHTTIDSPGYVRLTVTACDENGGALNDCDPFEGGACAGFNEILQAGKTPADFDEFWTRVIKSELDPISPIATEKREFPCGDPGDIVYDVKIACPGKHPVSGYLRMPRGAAPASLPIAVSCSGYGTSSASIPAKAAAIQLSINQHGRENGKPFEYYDQLAKAEYQCFAFIRAENQDPDSVCFKYLILRALQALRYCKTLPEWDGKTLIVRGGSMGAFQAILAAAWDNDVTRVETNVPWMCDLHGGELGRMRGWLPECDRGMDYYDTVSHASRVTCETIIDAGLGDYMCPPSGVTALYHSLRQNAKVRLTMRQNKTHSQVAPTHSSYVR